MPSRAYEQKSFLVPATLETAERLLRETPESEQPLARLELCPKYNKWTRLCSTMNTPDTKLIEELFFFLENGLE